MAGAAKAKADPFAPVRDKIQRLGVHLERTKNQISSGVVPPRHANKVQAYKEYLKREFDRTATNLENLKLSLPVGK